MAGLLASGAARKLGEEAGGGLMAGIVARVRRAGQADALDIMDAKPPGVCAGLGKRGGMYLLHVKRRV